MCTNLSHWNKQTYTATLCTHSLQISHTVLHKQKHAPVHTNWHSNITLARTYMHMCTACARKYTKKLNKKTHTNNIHDRYKSTQKLHTYAYSHTNLHSNMESGIKQYSALSMFPSMLRTAPPPPPWNLFLYMSVVLNPSHWTLLVVSFLFIFMKQPTNVLFHLLHTSHYALITISK